MQRVPGDMGDKLAVGGAADLAMTAFLPFTLVLALRQRSGGTRLVLPALLITAGAAWVLWLITNDDDGLSGLVTFPMTILLTGFRAWGARPLR